MIVDSVSVIVPHFNRPDHVREALLSIHAQTVRPAEVLLVDDGSSPEYQKKLTSLSDLATILVSPQNAGVSAARNLGAYHARSQWLAFLDDDDLWLPDKLERQIRYIEAHPEVNALGGGMTMRSAGRSDEYWGERETYKVTLAHALCFTASMSGALLIRRDVFRAVGGFNTRLSHMEDYEFGIRLLASGCETHFLGEPLFIYDRGGREQASAQLTRMYKGEMAVLNLHAPLARKEFGPAGAIRLKARCRKKHGLKIGNWNGRLLWALGSTQQAVVGHQLARLSA